MVVRDSHNGFTPASRDGRRLIPAPRNGKPQPTVVHPSVADTLVEGVRVVFDDWTDDMDRSLGRAAERVVRPTSSVQGVVRPGAPVVSLRSRAVGIVPVVPEVEGTVRPAPVVPQGPPARSRIPMLVAALVVAVLSFLAVGGVGALVIGLAAVAGAVLLLVPTGIDVVVVPAAGPEVEIVAPAGEGKSDAELVVMPDPGFRGGTTLDPVRK